MLSDGPMPRRIDQAVLWLALSTTDGALRVAGNRVSGHLFAVGGLAYFGVLDGEPPLPTDLTTTGIDPALWRTALSTTEASSSLSAALLDVGAPRDAVAAFGREAILGTVRRLSENDEGTLSVVQRHHPFGSRIRFAPRTDGPAWHLDEVAGESGTGAAQRLLDLVRPSRLDLEKRGTVLGRAGPADLDDRVGRSAYALVSDLRGRSREPSRRARGWRSRSRTR